MKYILRLKESHVFYGVLLLNLILIWALRFYASLDGAAHLYNSNLLGHILTNPSDIVSDYFVLNKVPLPNWISHLFLGSALLFFPAWMAEKLLLTFYVVGLALSFRLLIKTICRDNLGLSIIIFPFIFSCLFHMGFYNFSLSFVFFFFTLYYWFKNKDKNSFVTYLILSVLLILTYLCNALTYGFLGLSLGLFISINEYQKHTAFNRSSFLVIVKKLLYLFAASIVSLICLVVFILEIKFNGDISSLTRTQLNHWIYLARALYVYGNEQSLTPLITFILVSITTLSVYIRFAKTSAHKKFVLADTFWILSFIVLIVYYNVPNDTSGGMMSDRYLLLFFFLLITSVISLQVLPKRSILVFIALILIVHFQITFKQYKTLILYNDFAKRIERTADYITEGSLVYPVNMSDIWLDNHISNYLGVTKPLVILENYEATRGWFPLNWNTTTLHAHFGDSINLVDEQWFTKVIDFTNPSLDYVFCYGNMFHLQDENRQQLTTALNKHYTLIYQDDTFIRLYKRNR